MGDQQRLIARAPRTGFEVGNQNRKLEQGEQKFDSLGVQA
jgi:hypothetical protein